MLKGAVAKRYARAVFDIALEKNSIDAWLRDLRTLQAVFSRPDVAAFLGDVKPRFQAKRTVVSRVLAGLDPMSLNLALLLVSKNRVDIVGQILSEYETLVNQYRGVEVVEVRTAVALDDAEKRQLTSRLVAVTGRKVILQTVVDPEIMGGLVARIGDRVIDGSTKTKLLALKQRLAGAP